MKQRLIDKDLYLMNLQRQHGYENGMDAGTYLGFLVPNAGVILKRIDDHLSVGAPHVVAKSISSLLERM